jgi:hypothetical protein
MARRQRGRRLVMPYLCRMEPASYQYEPGPADQPPPPPPPPRTAAGARPGLIVLTAIVAQIVIIAAACNQWVTVRVARSILNDDSQFFRDVKASLLTYNWRFSPQDTDHQHIWLGQTLLILITLVFSAVLIAVVVRGAVTFDRAFLGCWMAITVATMLGAYARGLVNDAAGTTTSRLTRSLFGPLGPTSTTFFAGLVLGLVVAALAATVAVTTRRAVQPATGSAPAQVGQQYGPPPEQPPAFFGTPGSTLPPGGPASSSLPRWQEQRYGPPGRHAAPADQPDAPADQPDAPACQPDASATTRLPDPGEATTQFRPVFQGGDQPTTQFRPVVQGDQPTTQFPRPPDDEDLGHTDPEPRP